MDDIMPTRRKTIIEIMRLLVVCLLFFSVNGKKHKLKVEKDVRKTIDLTTFGFLQGGFLQVNVSGFATEPVQPKQANGYLGFTLNKLESSGMSYLESKEDLCLLRGPEKSVAEGDIAVIVFTMDFKNKLVHIRRYGTDVQNLTLSTEQKDVFDLPVARRRRSLDFLRDSYLLPASRVKRQTPSDVASETNPDTAKTDLSGKLPPHGLPSGSDVQPSTLNAGQHSSQSMPAGGETDSDQSMAAKNEVDHPPSAAPVTGQSFGTKLPLTEPGSTRIQTNQSEAAQVQTGQSDLTKSTDKENAFPLSHTAETKSSHASVGSGVIKDSFPMYIDDLGRFHFMFVALISTKNEEGLYDLHFHNCLNTEDDAQAAINFSIYLIEKNDDNYLSAGHIPLPVIYFLLSVMFFVLGCLWFYVLKKSTDGVYKIHYLMLTLVYIKSLALLFHAINYHFLATEGHHEEAIAIIYYITYLMRGILLFVTIVLIGAGWAFVKYILSDRDKKIFLVVIPLQVLANVAQIIIEETEEGESQFITWNEIFIIVDLLCCGAILFPVVWSIRHLQEASQTDGKAAINLIKLKLFRHFYILIVCYIYFTRIIVYLLRIAVPFQYEWMDEFFRELATMVFYVITAYKFRPAPNNPYLQVPQDSDDELEMDEVVTQSGAFEGLTKVNVKFSSGNGESTTASSTNKRESSHEYD